MVRAVRQTDDETHDAAYIDTWRAVNDATDEQAEKAAEFATFDAAHVATWDATFGAADDETIDVMEELSHAAE